MKRFILVLFIFLIVSSGVKAQIAAWEFNGNTGDEVTVGATTLNANLTATSVNRGAGLNVSALSNAFSSTNFTASGTFTDAVTNNKFIQFTINTVSGFRVSLSTLDANFRRSSTGPNAFQWQYSLDGFATAGVNIGSAISYTLTSTNGDAQAQINLSAIAALQNVENGITITIRLYGYGASATGGTFALGRLPGNDLAIGGTIASSNSISISSLTGSPFNLTTCAATGAGTINYTSIGTFSSVTFNAELSDAAGVFAATPPVIGTTIANGVNPFGPFTIAIPAGTASGTQYKIRIVTSPRSLASNPSVDQTVNQTAYCATNPTDYFRSVASGAWATLSIWESSNDSTTWIPATLIPGATAAHVVVRSPDSVYLTTNRTTTNLTILSGAAFDAVSFTMTASSKFNLLGTASFYQGGTVNPVPGIEQVLSTTSNYHYNGTQAGLSAALPEFGNLYWEPAPTVGGTLQNTINTAPFNNGLVIRGNMTVNIQGAMQREIRFATGSTLSRTHTIDGNLNIISSNSLVVVQNGGPGSTTTGTVNIGGNLNMTTGTFQGISSTSFNSGFGVVNLGGNLNNSGGVMQIGAGTGVYTFNYVNGGSITANAGIGNTFQNITVASGKTVTLNYDKNVTGDISLSTNSYIDLGTNNLTVSGTVSGGSATSYIRTASTGALILNNVASKDFPVGHTKYNPITIHTGSGHNWTVNVNDGVTADIPRTTVGAVLVTWGITPSVNPPNAPTNITFYFDSTLAGGQIGSQFNNPPYTPGNDNVQVWHRKQGYWLASGTTVPVDPGTPIPGYVSANALNAQDFSPYGISRISLPLPIKLVNFSATKISSGLAVINWELAACCSKDALFELEKSTDSRNYSLAGSINGSETNKFYFYNDSHLGKGISYYRLKMTDTDGSIKYSKVIAIVNEEKGFVITSIAPNPVQHTASLTISAAKQSTVDFKVYDLSGTVVKQWHSNISEGSNTINMNVTGLAAGTYHVLASSPDGRVVFRFMKQ